jgi:hypothetical protein
MDVPTHKYFSDLIFSPSLMRLLIGTSNFDEIIEENAFVVDKSLFIKEFIEDTSKVSVILRPRLFGKSLNLSMLKSFLSFGAVSSDFDRFLIANDKEFVSKHCGQYPVVFLDLKDCKGETWSGMYQKLWNRIRGMLKRHFQISEVPPELNFTSLLPPIDQEIVQSMLFWLTVSLNEKYGKRVIVLVDEYDAPLNHAFRKGFYDQASSFFGSFYSHAFVGNPAVNKACLIGTLDVLGPGILSGLENVAISSVSDTLYQSCFGFCIDEASAMLENVGRLDSFDNVMNWNNEYRIGSLTVINPWSFVIWLHSREFESHWVQTSNAETILAVLNPDSNQNLIPMILILMTGQMLDVSPLESQVNYTKVHWDSDSILHFLVHIGYLTYSKHESSGFGQVWIPNQAVREQWDSDIVYLLHKAFAPIFQDIK